MNNNFLLIQLNEINFELVDKYISSSKLKKFTNLRSLRESYNSLIHIQRMSMKIWNPGYSGFQ